MTIITNLVPNFLKTLKNKKMFSIYYWATSTVTKW